jgi:hypothetical protein
MSMTNRMFVPFVAAAMLCAPAALAENAPPPPAGQAGPMAPGKPMNKDDMAKMHARMCTDGYARAAGELTTVEIRLQLTAKQKPLFERWKAVKLTSAKTHADACAAMKLPDMDKAKDKAPSLAEGLKMEEKHLQARLDELKAEQPALAALEAVLTDEQKGALLPHDGPHDGPHGDGPMGGHHAEGPHGGPMGGPPDGAGAPPPPMN